METLHKLVLFNLDEQRCALDLSVVERGIRIVEITPAPGASPVVLGVINMSGRIVPVLNTRTLLGLPDKEVGLDDHLLIALASGFTVALLMDEIAGVVDFDARKYIASEDIFPDIGKMEGAVRLEEGIIFIYDLNRFLSGEDLACINTVHTKGTGDATNGKEQVAGND
jgi:purine-binding chemotaxis protein CheW